MRTDEERLDEYYQAIDAAKAFADTLETEEQKGAFMEFAQAYLILISKGGR